MLFVGIEQNLFRESVIELSLEVEGAVTMTTVSSDTDKLGTGKQSRLLGSQSAMISGSL